MKHLPHCPHNSGALPENFPCHCKQLYKLALAAGRLRQLCDVMGAPRSNQDNIVSLYNDANKFLREDWYHMGLIRDAAEALGEEL